MKNTKKRQSTAISSEIFEQRESGIRSYCRQFPAVFQKAKGAEIWDSTGRRYLDFLAGAGSLNYGHNNPVLKNALANYIAADLITHSLDMMTDAKGRFLQDFQQHILQPRNLDYVVQFTGPTGTNAVEAAFKLARKVTGRNNIVSFTNGFHGVSCGALAATGNRYLRAGAGTALGGVSVFPYDGYLGDTFNTIDYLEAMLDDPSSGIDTPAAVIVECIQGEGGLIAANSSWLVNLDRLCKRRNILLIIDDIQAGCGRSGSFFSFEEAGIQPDLVTMSKSLSGYGLPLAVLLIQRDLDVWSPGEHNGTFRGNNHAFITATAALNQYWQDSTLCEAVTSKGAQIVSRLSNLHEVYGDRIVDIRGRGMMLGIKCANPEIAESVTKHAYSLGLILERSGPRDEVIKLLMPLTIPTDHLTEGLDILEQSFRHVLHASSSGKAITEVQTREKETVELS